MPLKRIDRGDRWKRDLCRHPEHNPPGMICLPPGTYEHECPGCGQKSQFTVSAPTLTSRPFARIADRAR